MTIVRLALVFIALAACAPAYAAACATQPEAEVRELLERALSAYASQHFDEAQDVLLRAHDLCPSAQTYRALGLVAFELGRYRESAAALRSALGIVNPPLDEPLRTEAEAAVARAEALLAHLTLRTTPSHAELTVDGERVSRALRVLAVGEHLLTLSAPGYRTRRIVLEAHAGESIDLAIALDAVPLPPVEDVLTPRPSLPRPPDARAEPSVEHVERRWLWPGLATLTGMAAVALTLGLGLRRTEVGPPIARAPVAVRAGP